MTNTIKQSPRGLADFWRAQRALMNVRTAANYLEGAQESIREILLVEAPYAREALREVMAAIDGLRRVTTQLEQTKRGSKAR